MYNFTLLNYASKFRIASQNWQEFLVVPGVPARGQVMNDYLVPASEWSHFVEAWNGSPITVTHPKANNGSANSPTPDVSIIGRFYNAEWDAVNNRLGGEYWLNVNDLYKTPEGQQIAQAVKNGQTLETSTGYFADEDATPGEFEGKAYKTIHRNLRPDHIAILPNEEGACSVMDGCGVNRNSAVVCQNRKECPFMTQQNALQTARRPSYSGTEDTSWADVPKTLGAFADGWVKHGGKMPDGGMPAKLSDMPKACLDWIASKSLLGDPSADNPDGLMRFPVVNPETNKLNAGALRAVLSGRGAQADVPAASLDSARSVAKSLLESEFKLKENSTMKNFKEIVEKLSKLGVKANIKGDGEDAELEIVGNADVATPADDSQTTEPDEDDTPLFSTEEVAALKMLAGIAPALQATLKDVPAAIQMAKNAASLAEAEKVALVARIKANASNIYSDEELAGMGLPVLTKLNAQMNIDFSAAGVGSFQNQFNAGSEAILLNASPVLLAPVKEN